MLFNKRYIKGMAITLLALLIINVIINHFTLLQIQETTLTIDQGKLHVLTIGSISIVIATILVASFFVNNIKNHRFIQKKAEKDSETYLLNEAAMLHKLTEVLELYHNYGIVHSLLILNVTYRGNNKTLYEVVSSIETIIRKNDTLFRMDQGNFAIIANCGITDAINLGEKLIKKMAVLKEDLETTIDISIGITPTKQGDNKSQMLNRGLKSVDAAYKYGKNRVEYMN